jgi:hypothetical protein
MTHPFGQLPCRRRQGLTGDGGDDDEDELFAPFRKQLREQVGQLLGLVCWGRAPYSASSACWKTWI